MSDLHTAAKLALEAFETLTQYNMVRANIFRQFHPTATGDYVDLQEFREKALPAMYAIRKALSEESLDTEQPAQPQQEPVAWMTQARNFVHLCEFTEEEAKLYGWSAVYASPPAQRNKD